MNDIKLDPSTSDFVIESDDLVMSQDAMNAVYISLATERGSCIDDKEFGSDLHLITSSKAVAELPVIAREMCERATAWITADGILDKIEFTAEIVEGLTSRLIIAGVAWQSGQSYPFTYFNEVG